MNDHEPMVDDPGTADAAAEHTPVPAPDSVVEPVNTPSHDAEPETGGSEDAKPVTEAEAEVEVEADVEADVEVEADVAEPVVVQETPEPVAVTAADAVEDAPAPVAEVEAVAADPVPAEEEPAAAEEEPPVPSEPVAAEKPEDSAAEPEVAPAEPEVAPAEVEAVTAEAAPPPVDEAARPTPRPVPRPHAPASRPAPPAPGSVAAPTGPAAPSAPVPPALTAAESAEAARWGRVDDDGTVWVREATGERVVGQYPGADPADALAFYVRRYADLHAKVLLFEARLTATDLAVKEIDATVATLREELAEPAVVGDLDALRSRLDVLRQVAAQRRAAADAERAAAKAVALASRTVIVEAAEKIAGTDPERIQWRPAGEQLRVLLDEWKDAQRHGPRIDRGAEDSLWKRFSHARSTFDRERRRFFSELEKVNSSAKAEKAALVAEAEALSTSTEWSATSNAYRDLMTRWKDAGRANRKDDDALWTRFRAAQDEFFHARDAAQKETDAEFAANLEVKLALLDEAEKLVPVRDLNAARAGLRTLQERWEGAGKVPRADIQRVEGRLRAVEQAVREAEQSQWQRSNPETRARAEGAAAQLQSAIAGLEKDLADATAAGNQRKITEAQAALDARRSWLEQVERAAADSRG